MKYLYLIIGVFLVAFLGYGVQLAFLEMQALDGAEGDRLVGRFGLPG